MNRQDQPSLNTIRLRWLVGPHEKLWLETTKKCNWDVKKTWETLEKQGWMWNPVTRGYEDSFLEIKNRWMSGSYKDHWLNCVELSNEDCFLANTLLTLEGWYWNGTEMSRSAIGNELDEILDKLEL